MPTAYIALGTNLGDRAANIAEALRRIVATPGVSLARVSSQFENPAVGGPLDSPPFLNAVAEVTTHLEPRALLERLLEIEREMGRVRREKWGPRVIDLDLILVDDRVIAESDLTVPHPRMHERRFVLAPFAQIAPDAVHPILDRTIAELLEALPNA